MGQYPYFSLQVLELFVFISLYTKQHKVDHVSTPAQEDIHQHLGLFDLELC
jgi:hypothetical protein